MFIILGSIILIISFVIALISMIRELDEISGKNVPGRQDPERTEPVVNQAQNQPPVEKTVDQADGPFPWEESLGGNSETSKPETAHEQLREINEDNNLSGSFSLQDIDKKD